MNENGKITLTYSACQCFLLCPKKYYSRFVQEIEPVRKAESLILGSAVHKWLEQHYSQSPLDQDIALVEVLSPKARGCLLGIIDNYGRIYRDDFDQFDVLSVERLLSGPIINPETHRASANFAFGGKLDTLVRLKVDMDDIPAGSLAIMETKTAARVDSLFWSRIGIDPQVALYIHYLREELGEEIAGAIYNVIQKPSLRQGKAETVEEFENRVRVKMADPEFYHRRVIPISDMDSTELLFDLWNSKNFINLARKNGAFPKSSSACTMYNSQCDYLPLCSAKVPETVIRDSGIYQKRIANVELIEADVQFKEREQNVSVPF